MYKYNFDYLTALYRKNNFGQPCMWSINKLDGTHYEIKHGIIDKKISRSIYKSKININKEINTKINDKRKTGYKYLNELKDNVSLPVEEGLMQFLTAYLEDYRTTIDGSLLPMLAKTYDNTNNKLFKNGTSYNGQYKINGLRCFISAYKTEGLFEEIRLKFQSREGTYWNTLNYLEQYLLTFIPKHFLNKMIDEHYILDGELYLPGYSVNEINHFVKNTNAPENRLLQFWCYDLAIQDFTAVERKDICTLSFDKHIKLFNNKNEHLNNKEKFVILPSFYISTDNLAITYRDKFIDLGFEGLILRNVEEEYQFGKRNSAMIKYKKSTDGKFEIVAIIPEGLKRPDIPLFICKNDINDNTFECHCGGTIEHQKELFKNKEKLIGKFMYIEYGERSGVGQVPFHIKTTYII